MRLVHITCILLATTITCIATNDAGTIEGNNKTTTQGTTGLPTSAVPLEKSSDISVITNSPATNNTATTTVTTNSASTNITSNSSSTIAPFNAKDATTTTKTTNDTSATVPSNSTNTTINPTSSTMNMTVIPNTTIPINPTKPTPPTIPTTTTTTTTKPTGTVTSLAPETTAIPVSTKEAPPSQQERHFDGLSFLGGIILTTCLMGIGALSWKFIRTFSERRYCTL